MDKNPVKVERQAEPGSAIFFSEQEEPSKSELQGFHYLKESAAALGHKHQSIQGKKRPNEQLLKSFEDNARFIKKTYREVSGAAERGTMLAPVEEWLVDNYYLIAEQICEIREALPRKFYRRLPLLADSQSINFQPRVFALADTLVADTGGFLSRRSLLQFIRAYQNAGAVLTIGESWALPIALRIILIENLRRIAAASAAARQERQQADEFAAQILENEPDDVYAHLTRLQKILNRKRRRVSAAWLVQFVRRLRNQSETVAPLLDALDKYLSANDYTIEELFTLEQNETAREVVTIGNIISSFRWLKAFDWSDFFERINRVDEILRAGDPGGVYARMDFATRDRYRQKIERVARQSRASRIETSETEIARRVVELAATAVREKSDSSAASTAENIRSHVGYYLLDEGREMLEQVFDYRLSFNEFAERQIKKRPSLIYFFVIFLVVVSFVAAAILSFGFPQNYRGWLILPAVLILALVPGITLAVSVVNWLAAKILAPAILPKMDFSMGVPVDSPAAIVIPTIFGDKDAVREMLNRIEVHYLGNEDKNFIFAILSDFKDAATEHEADDPAILEFAQNRLERLNERYRKVGKPGNKFHLFHRRRLWSETENKWLGWERKRGKLEEFNRYLRGAEDTSFIVSTLAPEETAKIKYVITLDGDTKLRRGAARKLVGIIEHPLNQPQFSKNNRIERGYAILQPRISITAESTAQTIFARIMAGFSGLDPYTTAASDVYQDLFGAGIFTGKGLYAVDAFERALENRVPPESLLSHDLFESIFARAALVSDVEFFDDFPSVYETHAKRLHRWVRGDWQLLPWLFRKIPTANGGQMKSDLSFVSRWKIFDNLRRSLLAPCIVALLAIAWIFASASFIYLTFLSLLVLAFPVYAHVSNGLLSHPRGVNLENRLESFSGEIVLNSLQFFLTLVFLPHQAVLMTEAIVRTVWRVYFSRKNLLEWTTAAQIERASGRDFRASLRLLGSALILSLAILALVAAFRPAALMVAAPLLILWLLAPVFAFYLNQSKSPEIEPLARESKNELRSIARQTWRFFQVFIGAADNFLPPDNFQEDPAPRVAHRTSPTNIGLLFLANVAGHDFGYSGLSDLLTRTEKTLETVEKLEKFRGHLLNWYDTETLAPLQPKYVSTVDSGNLAAHLIALKQSLLEKITAPVFAENFGAGLADGWAEVKVRLAVAEKSSGADGENLIFALGAEKEFIGKFLASVRGANAGAANWSKLLDTLEKIRRTIGAARISSDKIQDLQVWLDSFVEQVESLRKDADNFFGWQKFAPKAEAESAIFPAAKNIRSLTDLSEKLAVVIERNEIPCDANFINEARQAAENAANTIEQFREQARTAEKLARAMDFKFLIKKNQGLFVIGFNVTDNRFDQSVYDLLASEARLASFWAIAKGDAPPAHWFKLGRSETMLSAGRALISWSGTMFEYLMPLLVMKSVPGTLLDQTCRAIIERQIEYGDLARVPWGVSESAYNARDFQLNYQYAPFGVPGLGLKRGLNMDLVVAPYASVLATMIEPEEAAKNLRRLANDSALGKFGFYEAIDFTPERLPAGENFAVVKNYMAHHQGMIFIALDNTLHDNIMQERFHRDAAVKTVELLLQERAVQNAPVVETSREEFSDIDLRRKLPLAARRVFKIAHTTIPQIQMLSNRNYSVMITNAGGGFSLAENTQISRWREDATLDNWGNFVYLSDAGDASKFWSAAYQPIGGKADDYEVVFTDDRAVFRRRDFGITTQTEIIVSSEDNAEMRQIILINKTDEQREIIVTSYAEIVLNTAAADAAHPAFNNLFVETEYVESEEAIIARRRPRAEKDKEIFGFHVALVDGERVGAVEFETDRAKFLGRGRTTANPLAITENQTLSKSVGSVIDPIFSLRHRLRIPPRGKASICFSTGIAQTREEAVRLADKYNNPQVFERESAMAWTKSKVEQRHLQIKAEEAIAFQSVAARLLYSSADFRAASNVVRQNTRLQSNLWAYGVSGDLPILLVKIKTTDDLNFVRQMLRGQEYLRLKGLKFDLVILNLHPEGYAQNVQEEIGMTIRTGGFQQWLGKPGGVFALRKNMLPEEDARLFEAIARVALDAERGSIVEQMKTPAKPETSAARLVPQSAPFEYADESLWIPPLKFFNGAGGFTEDGREYVVHLKDGRKTPVPWLNVIANEKDFGFQISESGAGFTWSVNSRENRLTTWTNDAVSDQPSEAFYLRDDETGKIWSPLPSPVSTQKEFVVKHGQGYSQFLHNEHGIKHDTILFTPLDATVKITILRIENASGATRKLSLWNYTELVLGVQREKSAPSIVSAIDTNNQILFAYNRYNNEFANRSAFLATNAKLDSYTCDRREFLGRNGNLEKPLALSRTNLLNRCDPKLDPCFATHTNLELQPNETTTIVFLLGETETDDAAREIVEKFRSIEECYRALDEVKAFWDETLTRIEIKTPDEATDLLVNRWLLYQSLVCRIWARSAFYQSGGAFGFRDQLQDVMALIYAKPEIARAQILLHAKHQFVEGDVQHWWHPPTGRGVRTRFSDDLLWLPFVVSFYIRATGDDSILDEVVPFIEAPLLAENAEDAYLQPMVSEEKASVFEHCARTIDRSLKTGAHCLPLMGVGDWNDGMSSVGDEGKGESVWVGWFLVNVINDFAPICAARNETERERKYLAHTEKLKTALDENAWDGEWFRRAYFDDGTPLGSKENEECQIDSIAQSWSVISGAANPNKAARAMASVDEYLIKRDDKMILLFTPPFGAGNLEPGYIKGYAPGMRENGGQYTHAAIWTVIAFANLGDGDKAGELFALLNPINHASDETGLHIYKVEPYVIAADVYAESTHTGRGGWTWYTGSASWMYRAAIESILGFQLSDNRLKIEPCIPRDWREFEIKYRRDETIYNIKVENPQNVCCGVNEVWLNGERLSKNEIPLVAGDEAEHHIKIILG